MIVVDLQLGERGLGSKQTTVQKKLGLLPVEDQLDLELFGYRHPDDQPKARLLVDLQLSRKEGSRCRAGVDLATKPVAGKWGDLDRCDRCRSGNER